MPSHLYSFSFAPNPTWSRSFSPQPEIQAYLKRVCGPVRRDPAGPVPPRPRRSRLGRKRRPVAAHDQPGRRTRPTSSSVPSAGSASRPIPDTPGLDSFEGPSFHSAELGPRNRSRGQAGRGDRHRRLGDPVRSARSSPKSRSSTSTSALRPWVLPRRDRPVSRLERRVLRAFPAMQKLVRYGDLLGPRAVRPADAPPAGRAAAPRTSPAAHPPPGQGPGPPREAHAGLQHRLQTDPACRTTITRRSPRRTSTSSPTGISEVRAGGVVTADGDEHPADVIIFGTGFKVTDMPIGHRIRGRDGRSLHETCGGAARMPTTGRCIAGFPNFFMLMGPGHRPRPHLGHDHDRGPGRLRRPGAPPAATGRRRSSRPRRQ